MNTKIKFEKVHLLIADQDKVMGDLLEKILKQMGMENILRARSGKEALQMLHLQEVDIVFAEWDLSPIDGVGLVHKLRESEIPQLKMIPVIMLTGRATAQDAQVARDHGVTEFLVKPYTPETLFNRLEHIVDFPRDFIMSENYIGPDRRRNKTQAGDERRKKVPQAYTDIPRNYQPGSAPIRILPKRDLAEKFGLDSRLRDLITPAMLEEAQRTIDSMREESLQWVAENMEGLEEATEAITEAESREAVQEAKQHLLAIKSRAGTFSYKLAAQVAFDLYRFLRSDFEVGNERHNLIIIKHVEVIKVLLAQRIIGEGTGSEKTLLEGLRILMQELNQAMSQEKIAAQQ